MFQQAAGIQCLRRVARARWTLASIDSSRAIEGKHTVRQSPCLQANLQQTQKCLASSLWLLFYTQYSILGP